MRNRNGDWYGKLCEECQGGHAHILTAKVCPECKSRTINGIIKRCASCAEKSNKCSRCDGKIRTFWLDSLVWFFRSKFV